MANLLREVRRANRKMRQEPIFGDEGLIRASADLDENILYSETSIFESGPDEDGVSRRIFVVVCGYFYEDTNTLALRTNKIDPDSVGDFDPKDGPYVLRTCRKRDALQATIDACKKAQEDMMAEGYHLAREI